MSPLVFCLFCIFCLTQGAWVPAKFTITSDNAYAVYVGDANGVTYLGSEFATAGYMIYEPEYYPVGPLGKNDPTPPATPLFLNDEQSVYVVAWADAFQRQGSLFNFEINGIQISSSNSAWKVFPSNFFPQLWGVHPSIPTPACDPILPPPYDRTVQFGQDRTAPPCPTWVAQQAALADQNNLWEDVVLGDNNIQQVWFIPAVTGIPSTARWMWYRSADCPDSLNSPFDNLYYNASLPNNGQCHHKEPLIFRIPATAWQVETNACRKTQSAETGALFCTGQCPQRPDGSSPQCVSIFNEVGHLRECECCGIGCELVAMPNLNESYCAGSCPNCQQCSPKEYGVYYPEPDLPQKYVRSCGCQPPAYTGRCEVDRCNNRCVGRCPLSTTECVPLREAPGGQIEECWCPPTNVSKTCRMVFSSTTKEPMCVGQCKNAATKCKAFYTDGRMTSCSCDCCDLERDPVNPVNNKCQGKCDTPGQVCQPNSLQDWEDPRGVSHVITTGCGCGKPQS
jgi:hypothetical protein